MPIIHPSASLLVSRWQNPPPPPGRHLLIEGASSHVYPLAHHCLLVHVLKRRSILVVDCGLRFDPYALTRPAKQLGADPEEVLRGVSIMRPFTAYQLVTALDSDHLTQPTQSLVVLGLMDLWRAEEMEEDQAQEAMGSVASALNRIREQGVSCLFFDKSTDATQRTTNSFLSCMTSRYGVAQLES